MRRFGVDGDGLDLKVASDRRLDRRLVQGDSGFLFVRPQVVKRGMAPGGGGEVVLTCPVRRTIRPVQLTDPGKIKRIRGVAYPHLTQRGTGPWSRCVQSTRMWRKPGPGNQQRAGGEPAGLRLSRTRTRLAASSSPVRRLRPEPDSPGSFEIICYKLEFVIPAVPEPFGPLEPSELLDCPTQIFGASFPSDGQQNRGVGQKRPEPVPPRHLHLHGPHERSQLGQVGGSTLDSVAVFSF